MLGKCSATVINIQFPFYIFILKNGLIKLFKLLICLPQLCIKPGSHSSTLGPAYEIFFQNISSENSQHPTKCGLGPGCL